MQKAQKVLSALRIAGVRERLAEIMNGEPAAIQKELLKLAKEIGCSTAAVYAEDLARFREHVVVDRIMAMARLHYQARISRSAFASAVAAAVSAAIALIAVLLG